MKTLLFLIFMLSLPIYSQQTAIVEGTGEKVSLYADGTWEYQRDTGNVESSFKNWASAIQNANYEQYKSLCSKGYIASKVDNAEDFYQQAISKKFSFALEEKKERQTRAVYTVIILRNGREVDAINLYFIAIENAWVIDGVSEDKKHTALFLEGKISGSFHPKNLDSITEVEVISKLLINGRANIDELKRYATVNPDTEKLLEYLGSKKLYYKSSHYSPELQKAAIVFQYEEDGPKGKSMVDICLYMKKQKSWVIYSRSNSLSNYEFLSDIYEK